MTQASSSSTLGWISSGSIDLERDPAEKANPPQVQGWLGIYILTATRNQFNTEESNIEWFSDLLRILLHDMEFFQVSKHCKFQVLDTIPQS